MLSRAAAVGIRRAVAAASPSPFAELVPVGRNRAAEISCLRRIDRVMVMTDRARVVLLMTGPAIARGRSFIPNRSCERAAWWPAWSRAPRSLRHDRPSWPRWRSRGRIPARRVPFFFAASFEPCLMSCFISPRSARAAGLRRASMSAASAKWRRFMVSVLRTSVDATAPECWLWRAHRHPAGPGRPRPARRRRGR